MNPVVRGDLLVSAFLDSVGGYRHKERRDKLLDILDVDLDWHMHMISDGERRRVQLVMGLMGEWDVLLLDEVSSGFIISFLFPNHLFRIGYSWPWRARSWWPSRILEARKWDKGSDYPVYVHTIPEPKMCPDIHSLRCNSHLRWYEARHSPISTYLS